MSEFKKYEGKTIAEWADLARGGESEIRSTNKDTGGQKGVKLYRFDLIPAFPEEELALLYGLGAKKYTKSFPVDADKAVSDMERDCTCQLNEDRQNVIPTGDTQQKDYVSPATRNATLKPSGQDAIQIESDIVGDCVARVTTGSLGKKIQNMPLSKRLIMWLGWKIIGIGNEITTRSIMQGPTPRNGKPLERENEPLQDMDSLGKTIALKDAKSVEALQREDGLTSTTITTPGNSGDSCVGDATRALDSFKMIQELWNLHSDTCNVRNYVKFSMGDNNQLIETTTGDRNWERGYEWSKSYGALRRHISSWWQGEDMDPETNVSHLTNVAWHAFALTELSQTHPELDDRP